MGDEFGEHVDTNRTAQDVGGLDFAVDAATEDAGDVASVVVERDRDATAKRVVTR